MQNEANYTVTVKNTNGTVKVIRKADNKHIGTIVKLHRGWEANLGAGIRRAYATKAEAFAAFTK